MLHHFLLHYIIIMFWHVQCLRCNGVHFINQQVYCIPIHKILKHVHYFAISKAWGEKIVLQEKNCDENKGLLIKWVSDSTAIMLQFWQPYSIEVHGKITTSGKQVMILFKVLSCPTPLRTRNKQKWQNIRQPGSDSIQLLTRYKGHCWPTCLA